MGRHRAAAVSDSQLKVGRPGGERSFNPTNSSAPQSTSQLCSTLVLFFLPSPSHHLICYISYYVSPLMFLLLEYKNAMMIGVYLFSSLLHSQHLKIGPGTQHAFKQCLWVNIQQPILLNKIISLKITFTPACYMSVCHMASLSYVISHIPIFTKNRNNLKNK